MQLKDSAAIAYSAEPQVLTISILKNEVMDILQNFARLNLISISNKRDEISDGDSREQVLLNLKHGFKDMQAIKKNKLKTFPVEDLFNA
jgi:transcription initiation factor IIE alpha subunit